MESLEDFKENEIGLINKNISKDNSLNLSKMSRNRCQKAKKTLGFIKERMLQYEKKLQEIKDRIVEVSPQKWIGDEENEFSECESYENFDIADFTPGKGGISDVEKKRRIFDMMKSFTSCLQKKFKMISLRQNQIAVIQKLKSGNNVALSDIENSGKSMIYVLMKSITDKRYASNGIFLVFLPVFKLKKVVNYLEIGGVKYQIFHPESIFYHPKIFYSKYK